LHGSLLGLDLFWDTRPSDYSERKPLNLRLNSERDGLFHYHSNFNPSCTWRDVVAVDVMTPAVGEGPPVAAAYTTGFGVLKFV
jgi:hypothetical protein